MTRLALALLLQAGLPAQTGQGAQPQVQLGVRINPDTVTVGQRFIVLLKVRAPAGATVQFPLLTDSAAASPTGTQVIGEPLIQNEPDAGATVHTAVYRLTAWDTGPQPLLLGNIVVRANGQTGYVSMADHRVMVRSVLPADSARRVPKPPRETIPIEPFSEVPWLIFFALVLLAGLASWLWQIYRRRRDAPLDPFAAAERDFSRIDALSLVASGDGERHVAMMVDTMRIYLAARVPGIELSHTSSELIAAAGSIQSVASGLGGLLWRADLVKFAGHRMSREEALETGSSAREIVRAVETELAGREAEARRVAARRAA